jgi:hypothetical protein
VCKNVQQDWNNSPPYFLDPKPLLNSWKPKKGLSEKGKTPFFSKVIIYLEQARKMHPNLALTWKFCFKIHVVKCSMKLALASF